MHGRNRGNRGRGNRTLAPRNRDTYGNNYLNNRNNNGRRQQNNNQDNNQDNNQQFVPYRPRSQEDTPNRNNGYGHDDSQNRYPFNDYQGQNNSNRRSKNPQEADEHTPAQNFDPDARRQHDIEYVQGVLVDLLVKDPARLKADLFNPRNLEEAFKHMLPVTNMLDQEVKTIFERQFIQNCATALEDVFTFCYPKRTPGGGWASKFTYPTTSRNTHLNWKETLQHLIADMHNAKDWMGNMPAAKCDHWLVDLVLDNMDLELSQFVLWSLKTYVPNKSHVTVKQLELHLNIWVELFESNAAQIYVREHNGDPSILNPPINGEIPNIVRYFASDQEHSIMACRGFNQLYLQSAVVKLSYQGFS